MSGAAIRIKPSRQFKLEPKKGGFLMVNFDLISFKAFLCGLTNK